VLGRAGRGAARCGATGRVRCRAGRERSAAGAQREAVGRGLGFQLVLYACVFDPTTEIYQGFIQRLGYIGPHSAGPKTVEWAELHYSFPKKIDLLT
jgi:hypothetical protein